MDNLKNVYILLLVQVIAVLDLRFVVACTEFSDPFTCLQHNFLWNCQHNPEEVWVFKCL